MSRSRSLLAGVLLAVPFYLLLIDTVDTPELIAALVAALLAGGMYELAYSEGADRAAYRLGWLTGSWRVVVEIPVQIALVCIEIAEQTLRPRTSRGQLRATTFRCRGAARHDLGRRALAEALGSLAPNTIVVGIDPKQEQIVVHQLRRTGADEQLDPLRLGHDGTDT